MSVSFDLKCNNFEPFESSESAQKNAKSLIIKSIYEISKELQEMYQKSPQDFLEILDQMIELKPDVALDCLVYLATSGQLNFPEKELVRCIVKIALIGGYARDRLPSRIHVFEIKDEKDRTKIALAFLDKNTSTHDANNIFRAFSIYKEESKTLILSAHPKLVKADILDSFQEINRFKILCVVIQKVSAGIALNIFKKTPIADENHRYQLLDLIVTHNEDIAKVALHTIPLSENANKYNIAKLLLYKDKLYSFLSFLGKIDNEKLHLQLILEAFSKYPNDSSLIQYCDFVAPENRLQAARHIALINPDLFCESKEYFLVSDQDFAEFQPFLNWQEISPELLPLQKQAKQIAVAYQRNNREAWLKSIDQRVQLLTLYHKSSNKRLFDLVNEIYHLGNPHYREKVASKLFALLIDPMVWEKLSSFDGNSKILIPYFLTYDILDGSSYEKELHMLKSHLELTEKLFADGRNMEQLLTLLFLLDKMIFSADEKAATIHQIFYPDLKKVSNELEKKRVKGKERQQELAKIKKEYIERILAIQSLIIWGKKQELITQQPVDLSKLKEIFKETFVKELKININGINNFEESYKSKISILRNEKALFVYSSKLALLKDDAEKLKEQLGNFIFSLLTEDFPKCRYEQSPQISKIKEIWHAKEDSSDIDELFKAWQKGETKPLLDFLPEGPPYKNREKWELVDTDDPSDLILIGHETGACQDITKSPSLSKAALAYMIDGKNRLLAIKEENGKLVARHILRLMMGVSTQKPVLLLEKYYSLNSDPLLKVSLLEFAISRAKKLKLKLVEAQEENEVSAEEDIESIGSNALYEYADSVNGITQGKFTVKVGKVLYNPS